MTELFRQRLVLAKIESSYGVDAAPTGAANAILTSEPTITPLEGELKDRNLLYPELGASPQIPVGSHVRCRFMVEIAGSGTVDVAPAYGPLLRACGMAETINAAVSVEYDPVSSGEESASLYFHLAGTLHKLLGARGNVALNLAADDIPHFEFDFVGLWADPAAAALPTADYTAFVDPITVSNANTPTFTLHGLAAILNSLRLDLGNQIVHRDRVNSEVVLRSDRNGGGNVTIDAPAIGTKNFFTAAKNADLDALQIIHGLVAGNTIQVDVPKAQLTQPQYGEDSGVATLSMGLILTRNTGDDEIKITCK